MKKVVAVLLAMMLAVSAGTVVFGEELEKNQEDNKVVSSLTKQNTEKPSVLVTQVLQKGPIQTYGITIAGKNVTSENATDVFEDGTVSYDAAQQILTLNGASINAQTSQAIRVDNQSLTIRLIGTNKITGTDRGIYCGLSEGNFIRFEGSGSLTVTVPGDAIQADRNKGGIKIIIDGCTLNANSTGFSGIGVYFGDLIIQNYATVTATSGSDVPALAAENIQISNSSVTATASGDYANAVYANGGAITISNSNVIAETISEGAYPALYGTTGVDISNSIIQVVSSGDVGIYSPAAVQIQNTVAEVTAPNGRDSIRGNGGTNLVGSWIESIGGSVNKNAVVADSVTFQDQKGIVVGNAVLSGEASVDQTKELTVPDGSSLTVSGTGKLTNYGTILVKRGGSLINKGIIENKRQIIIEKGGKLEGNISGSGTVNNYNTSGSIGVPGTGIPIGTGTWKQSPAGWWYQNPDGSYPANQWKYLDSGKGYKAWYWFNQNGYITFGWQKVGNTWYYMNRSGEMQTGWQFVGNKWYYLNSNGAMATGWVKDGNKWYFMNKDGSMHFGWLNWAGYWYHLDSHGIMSTGWKQVNGKWYYMYAENGRMAANTTTPDGYRVGPDGAWVK